ncbi:putative protein phloem protein 2-like a3, partial [Phtheirospermum japonicum]
VLENGQILNVIDIPRLFDFSADVEHIGKEIVKCVDMAKDGIHVVLVVLSTRCRSSREEEDAIEGLRKLFGSKISDYMIVSFTAGNDLAAQDETLDDYLGRECPKPFGENLKIGNICVLFDNRTYDASKKSSLGFVRIWREIINERTICSNGSEFYFLVVSYCCSLSEIFTIDDIYIFM